MNSSTPLDRTLQEDFGYCLFGAETLSNLLKVLENQMEGVQKSNDIEYIHKMRVASRRIRAALPLFVNCFPKKSYKKWLKEIKGVTGILGSARDTDVQIAFVNKYLDDLNNEKIKIGVEVLLSKHIERRVKTQPEINNKLDQLRTSHEIENIRDYCQQVKQRSNAINASIDTPSTYTKAHTYISEKLGDFLVMEDCVHHENDIVNHHRMRIRAKWLRYTMEIFSSKYDEKLKEYISVMKHFQDLLGEMHDYDVWINFIPKFIADIKVELASRIETNEKIPEIENGLLRFRQDIQEMRRSKYKEFVSFWEDTKKKHTFERLRQITSAEFMGVEKGIKSLIEKDNPKIAVLADVHANLHALKAVMDDARGKGIEVILHAGDFVGYGAFRNEVIEILRSNNVLNIIGNYDLKVLEGRSLNSGEKDIAFQFSRKKLTRTNKSYLNSLPKNIALDIKETKLLMVHGSPESIEEHIYPNTSRKRIRELISGIDVNILIVGHSHRQFSRTIDDVTIINPGSVGRSDDNNPKAAYAIIGFNPFSVELVRVSYDIEAAVQAIRVEGLPETFAQMLLCGLPLKKIRGKEWVKKSKMSWKNKETLKIIKKVALKYENDSTHSEQVKKLAIKLFDTLKPLHKLGSLERYWLESAALLHDIGWSRGGTGHNKTSLKLILNDCDLPFTTNEKYIIGSIARYHRKKTPKKKHYNYAPLSPKEKQKVDLLSSILRVADALDFSHGSIVKNLKVNINTTTVTAKWRVNKNPVLEEQSLNKKKDLFEKTFNKDLVVLWNQSS
jgi:putative phosphoesterase